MNGSVAVVTGAASGIGKAVANALAARGDAVCVVDTDPVGDIVAEEIRSRGGTATFVHADVCHDSDVDRMVARTLEEWGRLDYACNCAGVLHERTPTADLSTASWNRVISVNLSGTFQSMRAEIPALMSSGGGVIVNFASVAGLYGSAATGLAAYAASKAGVIQLTKVAAHDYARLGLRVVAIAPGAIDTPMIRRGSGREVTIPKPELAGASPFGRLGHPDEVAMAVLWLCSPAASHISGTTIQMDGGKYG